MKSRISMIFIALALSYALHAGSVRLVNDSSYRLRVVVCGSDGSQLSNQVIDQQSSGSWSDNLLYAPGGSNPIGSVTPYNIYWYCMDGSQFSVSTGVSPGGTTTAMTGTGPRQCNPPAQTQQSPQYPPEYQQSEPYQPEPYGYEQYQQYQPPPTQQGQSSSGTQRQYQPYIPPASGGCPQRKSPRKPSPVEQSPSEKSDQKKEESGGATKG